jgi:hypothetical protein
MSHYTEDDLVLYYYDEGLGVKSGRKHERSPTKGREKELGKIAQHLAECKECAETYRSIADTLKLVTELTESDVPERNDQYGLEVWQQIRHKLPERGPAWWMVWLRTDRLVGALATAALVLVAFAVGYMWPRSSSETVITGGTQAAHTPANGAGVGAPEAGDARRRILMISIADHLESSERVLTDIMNAPARSDISAEQGWANDLLTTSRLYRQDAIDAGEQSIASVLDELERSLLEIVHSGSDKPVSGSAKPATTAKGHADLDEIRRRIDATALLFKVRVMSNELRERQETPAETAPPRTSTRKIS